MDFSDLGVDHRLVKNLGTISNPTEIQEKSIPLILKKADVLGIAPTGSGKTLAYLLPTLTWLLSAKIPHNHPSILLIVPTRELARQVSRVLNQITSGLDIHQVVIYTGQNQNKLKRLLQELPEIIIATPGLLLKFVSDEQVYLGRIQLVILDEIDRLLDLGFEDDIKQILEFCPPSEDRTTLLFGATLPRASERIAKRLQAKSHLVDVGRAKIPKTIRHEVYEVMSKDKFHQLVKLLHKREMKHVLIFTPSIESTRALSRNLNNVGLELEEIHSGLTQQQRNQAINNFSNNLVDVLVATDIGARGLDLHDISHVISLNIPRDHQDYIHRAGRTGRAGAYGTSILLADETEVGRVRHIEHALNMKFKRVRRLPVQRKTKKKISSKRIVKKRKSSKKRVKKRKRQ